MLCNAHDHKRGYALDVLIAAVASGSTIEVAFRHEEQRSAWFAASAMALVVLALTGPDRPGTAAGSRGRSWPTCQLTW